jgi:hypothetical protein
MDSVLTVRELVSDDGALEPCEVLAGEGSLGNAVTWVVSLRPFPPAFPRLKGGELALVATEHLARLDPPTTLSSVIRQLASRDASAVAVRGSIDPMAVEAAEQSGLPFIHLSPDAPLHDIEQAVMRACALYQARREMMPPDDPNAWVDDLLAGRFASQADAQTQARRNGYNLAPYYWVAYLMPAEGNGQVSEEHAGTLGWATARINTLNRTSDGPLIARLDGEGGVAVVGVKGAEDMLAMHLQEAQLACGISEEKPALMVPEGLQEARLAAVASARMHRAAPVRYADMGADRLVVLLYRDHPGALRAFVNDTLGPLIKHDERSATPLLPTVKAFTEHGGRLRETAAEIFVHRNTLAYRLDRAAELLGADLKDASTRLAVEIALRALHLLDSSSQGG